ncbi:MAG: rhamnulokinase family protein [Verrucomicrobiota bacterium]
MKTHHIAIDFGAESARVMLGILDSGQLTLEEIHRFPTGGTQVLGNAHWNIVGFFDEVKKGLFKVGERGLEIHSISADSWGVDYVYFNSNSPLITQPFHYRHSRTQAPFHALTPGEKNLIYGETGIQFMALNTLYQLIADKTEKRWIFDASESFLTIADYIHYLLSGKATVDQSLASTTQVYNPIERKWSSKIMEHFGLPSHIFPKIVPCGTILGPLRSEIQNETRLPALQVISTCSHDTAAAIAAIPAEGDQWAYLSSGTWSLIGVELPHALINSEVQEANFTNEVGYGNTIRFLKNITGLWILQECKRQWDREGSALSYAELNVRAQSEAGLRSFIDPTDSRFYEAGEMVEKIQSFCRETKQPIPETPGQITRCILESLALLYSQTVEQIRSLTNRKISALHIVGGGSQSHILNQFAANACGIPILAGPVEATAAGNILLQSLALGHIASLSELRKIVRNSFPIQTYQPEEPALWEKARQTFQLLKK